MKKNITINLYGTLYAIDEDACQLLEQYTETMRSYCSKQAGGDEIIDDIEHRIAELLWEHKEQGNEAVDIETIKGIMGKIGNPEQMSSEEQGPHISEGEKPENNNVTDSAKSDEKNPKKLFRNGNDKMMGGVLSGLAQYFGGKDPLPWRIGFVILFFVCLTSIHRLDVWYGIHGVATGMFNNFVSNFFTPINFCLGLARWSPLIAYMLLWAFVPEAKTVEDRLKMKGKKVNSDTIKKEVIIEHDMQNQPHTQNNNGCANGCLSIIVFLGKLLGICTIGCMGVIVVIIILTCILGWGATKVDWDFTGLPAFITNHTSLSSCGAPTITRNYEVTDFSEIELKGIGTVNYTQGKEYSLRAEGDSCRVVDLQIVCRNGKLEISNKEYNNDHSVHGAINYYVTAPSINEIDIKGACSLNIDSISQKSNLEIDVRGVGNAEITYVNCPEVTFKNTGVGYINANVETKEVIIHNTGVGGITVSGHTEKYEEKAKSEFTAKTNVDNLIIDKR